MDIEQIREKFPDPVGDQHYCPKDPCTHYCVLGAVLSTITGKLHQFPEPVELIEHLKLDDGDIALELWKLALAVMHANDKYRFDEAWSQAGRLLALLREHGLYDSVKAGQDGGLKLMKG